MKRRALLFTITIVLALCAACGWWLHVQKQQYARNRQLIAALKEGDFQAALVLVNAGADPNTRELATPAPSLQLLFRQFLSHKPPVNSSDTAFMLACGAPLWRIQDDLSRRLSNLPENVSLIEAMLTHHAQVNAKAVAGVTALHHAISENRLRTVELLLQHGANVNAQDAAGYTALMLATPSGNVNIVHLLFLYGANLNGQNEVEETALYIAVQSPLGASVIPELLAHGADPNLSNNTGRTPLQLAQEEGRSDLVRLLKQHGAK